MTSDEIIKQFMFFQESLSCSRNLFMTFIKALFFQISNANDCYLNTQNEKNIHGYNYWWCHGVVLKLTDS